MIQSRVEVSCGSVGLLLFENVPRHILLYKKERLGQKTSGRKD